MDILNYFGLKKDDETLEIRLRTGKKIILVRSLERTISEWYLKDEPGFKGGLTENINEAKVAHREIVMDVLNRLLKNSLYAYETQIKNGYFTVKGGHRIGVVGEVIMEGDAVRNIKNISSLNIRLAHEVKGCSDGIISRIISSRRSIHNTLIISPPMSGKTTLLRDIIRNLSNGMQGIVEGMNVGVVDERSEIAGCYDGVMQKDLGERTDVITGVPKSIGMNMLLRSMSPKIIALDEIGMEDDLKEIYSLLNSGVSFICTMHASSLQEARARLGDLITRRIFKRIIIMSNVGRAFEIKSVEINE